MLSMYHVPEPDVLLGELSFLGLACLPGDVSQEANRSQPYTSLGNIS